MMAEAFSFVVTLAALLVVGWLAWRQSVASDARYDRLLATQELEREQWRSERGELLNRIRPETAQYPIGAASPEAVHFDDDEDGWDALNMSKEALAKAVMSQEIAER